MTTKKQIAANRLNALKSTGPRTPEGKNHSRLYAVTHGLTARTPILAVKHHRETTDPQAENTAFF